MLDENWFKDIRRNLITSSLLYIFFLIYWKSIQISKVWIFTFNVDGFIVSPYIDIAFFLTCFLLYSFYRYKIYTNEFIDEVLISWKNLVKNISLNKGSKYLLIMGKEKFDCTLKISNDKIIEAIVISDDWWNFKIKFNSKDYYSNTKKSKTILSNKNVSIVNNNNVDLSKLSFKEFFFSKEYSDYAWPLYVLPFTILMILVLYVIKYLFFI